MLKSIRGDRGNQVIAHSPPMTPEPRLSHKAALVAQEMETLEASLAASELRAQDMENRARVAEGQLSTMSQELAHVRDQCDVYLRRYLDMVARLESAGAIILDVLKGVPDKRTKAAGPDLMALEQQVQQQAEEAPKLQSEEDKPQA